MKKKTEESHKIKEVNEAKVKFQKDQKERVELQKQMN